MNPLMLVQLIGAIKAMRGGKKRGGMGGMGAMEPTQMEPMPQRSLRWQPMTNRWSQSGNPFLRDFLGPQLDARIPTAVQLGHALFSR